METPLPPELNDWFVLLSGQSCCNFCVCADCYDWCPLGIWVCKGHLNWKLVCIFLLISALVLMLVSANYGIWHIEIYPGPPWLTRIVVFIFPSVSSLQCLVSIFPITACLKRESDLIKIVEDLSHFDSPLICWHTRKGMVLRFPGTPMAFPLDEPYGRDQIACWLASMAINLPAEPPCQKRRQTGIYWGSKYSIQPWTESSYICERFTFIVNIN